MKMEAPMKMMTNLQNLKNLYFFLHFLCLLGLSLQEHVTSWNTRDFLKRDYSLIKPYTSTGTSVPLWDFLGSVLVTQNYVRLTPDRQSQRGAIWSSVPVWMPNWEMQVHFRVHGSGKDLYGDGFAVWYAKERMQIGSVFGGPTKFSGLGIYFDTYNNHNGPHNHGHPYISAMVNNGSLVYDHDTDGTHTEIAGCEAKFRGRDYDTYVAIRYEGTTLTVSTDTENKQAWKECFKTTGIRLPTGYYFGASAATGDLADNHDIISMKVYELVDGPKIPPGEDRSLVEPSSETMAAPRDHVHDAPSSGFGRILWKGIKMFLWVFFGLLAIAVVGILGFWAWKKKQENSRKRFY